MSTVGKRYIAHIDMDCFFVSVERLKNPSLNGKPVIVGGDPSGRSVVASASYEARRFGIQSAMPVSRAMRLCPDLIIVKGSFSDYDFYHHKIRSILQRYSPCIEMASIDEGYIDLSGTEHLWGPIPETAAAIHWDIYRTTGLSASVGLASNKLVAKIASDFCKPDGFLYIPHGKEKEFLFPLPVEDLPGVGTCTREMLSRFAVHTIGELASLDEKILRSAFGVYGSNLWRAANGTDDRLLSLEWDQKSISREVTFAYDSTDPEYLTAVLHHLVESVCRKARNQQKRGRRVTIKIRYEDFETITRSRTMPFFTNDDETVSSTAISLFRKNWSRRVGVRLIGVNLSDFVRKSWQLDLFQDFLRKRQENILRAKDTIRQKYGFNSLLSGDGINLISYRSNPNRCVATR